MKRKKLALLIAAAVFVALFVARFAYELSRGEPPRARAGYGLANQEQGSSIYRAAQKNYASEKIVIAQPRAATQVVDQKYERVAELDAQTASFDDDTSKARAIASEARAVIQREDAFGLPGSRVLALTLGIVPESFDQALSRLREVGSLRSITVTKTDRTADFKALEAKRLSLEKTRDGLRALRRAGAALSDLVALETKILEIEGHIQELGISLGDFSESNSFCTINARLTERAPSNPWPRILRSALDALGWTTLVALGLAAVGLASVGTAALAAHAVSKFREASAKRPT